MSEEQPEKSIDDVIRLDGWYPSEAFAFLHEGLAKAVGKAYGDQTSGPGRHHVTGEQICEALRELAAEKWGMLAPTVLATWNIHETIDFGRMVYLLIDRGLWHRTEEDSINDFANVFDISEAFKDGDDFDPSRDQTKKG